MFYDTAKRDHGLPQDPLKAVIVPRPIGWISTVDKQGRVNLAPYSFYNGVGEFPPMVYFAITGTYGDTPTKHSRMNAEETGEFVVNMVSAELAQEMNVTTTMVDYGVDEMKLAGLAPAPSRFVKPPRVAGTPAALECKLLSVQQLQDIDGNAVPRWMVLGQVVGIFIDDAFVKDGRFDTAGANPIARCGYADYAAVTSLFSIQRPAGG